MQLFEHALAFLQDGRGPGPCGWWVDLLDLLPWNEASEART